MFSHSCERVRMDLFLNPGKLWEPVRGKSCFLWIWGSLWVWHSRNWCCWQEENSKADLLGEGSGVLLLPELGLGLDFPFGNSQQSSFLSQTSPSNKTPAGNGDGLLTAKQEFHRIPWISVLVCLDCSRAEVLRCRSRRDELRAGFIPVFPVSTI